jgi:FkbM family methyltransferase
MGSDTNSRARIGERAVRLLAASSRAVSVRGQVRLFRRVLPPSRVAGLTTVLELRDGRRFQIAASEYLEWYLLFFGNYEPEITRLLPLLVESSSVAIDVGANIGVHALTMANLASDGRVLACEPHPVTVERLRGNLALNNTHNVEIVPEAMSDSECGLDLYDSDDGHKGMASLHCYDGWVKTAVRGSTVDALVNSRRITTVDIIKVDVEGHEAPVLKGASTVLARDRPSIIFEYVDWAWGNCGFLLDETLTQLRDFGYKQFYLIERSGLARLSEPLKGSGNILAVGRAVEQRYPDLPRALHQYPSGRRRGRGRARRAPT